MMHTEIILFFASIFPVFLIGLFIYKRDKNKESSRLLVKLFFGGIAACFIAIIATILLREFIPFFELEAYKLSSLELVIYVFIGVALIEELSKWIMTYKLSYFDIEFDELYDMVLYCVFVALGFACFENLFYVYEFGLKTSVLRALLAVPGHACDGFFMGYYLGLSKLYAIRNQKKMQTKYMILSILIPTLTHGLYDYCLYNGSTLFEVIFYIFVVIIFIYVIVKIIKISRGNIMVR